MMDGMLLLVIDELVIVYINNFIYVFTIVINIVTIFLKVKNLILMI